MQAATNKRTKAAVVTVILLALAFANAAALCAATAAVHPCCPASPENTTRHCVRLGCAMSDPALQVKSESVNPIAGIHTPQHSLTGEHFFIAYFTRSAESSLSTRDRSLTFHQLLI